MGRRAKGEGTIFQRKDGMWVSRILGPDGKSISLYDKTPQGVLEKRDNARADQKQGILVVGPSLTLKEFLTHWLKDVIKVRVRPRTYETYDLQVRRLLPYLGKYKLSNLTPTQIQSCYSTLIKTKLSPRSVEIAHGVLRHALEHALRTGLIGRNVAKLTTPPRAKSRKVNPLDAEQLRILFTTEDEHNPLWIVIATMGLRLGEACGLRWGDIDFERKYAVICRTVQRYQGIGMVIQETKTDHSRRMVVLCDMAVEILFVHRARQEEEYKRNGLTIENSLIFCRADGSPLTPSQVEKGLMRVLTKAGLPKIRVHDLRHSAASYLLARGVHPKIVQEMLGHSTIRVTMDTYSHVLPILHKEIAEHMDALRNKVQ